MMRTFLLFVITIVVCWIFLILDKNQAIQNAAKNKVIKLYEVIINE